MAPVRHLAADVSEDEIRAEELFEDRRLTMIKLKRAYDPASKDDGIRFLVERLWPRGVKKTALRLDAWLKDVAPSTELRRWFSHDPSKWMEFQRRYFAELDAKPATAEPIRQASRRGQVTLVYSSHDQEHNNAVALKAYLAGKTSERGRPHRAA
jgi:uncharacterized protein YeaO (DUF488 family)